MGRTLPTATGLFYMERASWKPFREKLKKEKKAFDHLWVSAKLGRHENTAAMATKAVPFQFVMMSMLFQTYRLLAQLEKHYGSVEPLSP